MNLKTNGKNPGWKDPKWSEKQNKKNPGWKSPEWKSKSPEWKNKSPEWKSKSPEWKNKSPEWKSPEWKDTGAEKYDFDKEDLGLAFNLTEALRHEYLAKNGSKIVNWMITNDGKQTIIVL